MKDNQIDQMLKSAPLVRFSIYTEIQTKTVLRLSEELINKLDTGFQQDKIDGTLFPQIYGLFWLWVLGAYEITRTMSEYNTCFSGRLNERVARFKKSISVLRIPFAKQQFQGSKNRLINGEASVSSVDCERKDLMFKVKDSEIWMRPLLTDFERLVRSIQPEDVLKDLRAAHQ